MFRFRFLAGAVALVFIASFSKPTLAQIQPAEGFVYAAQQLPDLTEGCLAHAPGGLYAGIGPALSFPASGGTRDVVFVTPSGAARTVVTGFNAIGGCLYDGVTDTLYVVDNGGEFADAVTGDTVFEIPAASLAENLPAAGLEMLPAGSIPDGAGIAMDAVGNLFVTDAAGAGAGDVLRIDVNAATPFVENVFDFTGGIAFDQAGDLFVADSDATDFSAQVRRFSGAGVFKDVVSAPTFAHGSVDLAFDLDGSLIATGAGSTVARVDGPSASTPLMTGFDSGFGGPAFGGAVVVEPFTGRIDLLASSFTGSVEDASVHQLVPVDRLAPGLGAKRSECVNEFYGVGSLVPATKGARPKVSFCVDGEPCDDDGVVNDRCTFRFGLCANVADPRFARCRDSNVSSFDLRARPANPVLADLAATIGAALPIAASTCAFTDGVEVPVRIKGDGSRRSGRVRVRVTAESDSDRPRRDKDVVRMVCAPPR